MGKGGKGEGGGEGPGRCLERDSGLRDILPYSRDGEEGTRLSWLPWLSTRESEEGTKRLVQHRNYPTITGLVLGSVCSLE